MLSKALYDAAYAEIQAGACEVGGNNRGPWVEKYLNAEHPQRISHTGEPWCCAFYCWCLLEAERTTGIQAPYAYTRSCTTLMNRFAAAGRFIAVRPEAQQLLYMPEIVPGSAVFWDFNANGKPNHVNVLHGVIDGELWTIGGNEGNEASGAPVRLKNRGPLGTQRGLLGFGVL